MIVLVRVITKPWNPIGMWKDIKKKKKKKEASIVSFNPLIMNLSFISCRNEKRVIEAATTVIYARDRMAQSSLTHNDII